MGPRFGLIGLGVLLSLPAQTPTASNVAYQQFQAARYTPEGVSAAAAWVQVYEQQTPNSRNVPPYVVVARYYADRGVHLAELPELLEKAVREIAAPGGFTDTRTRSNSPFEDDIDRSMIAALYVKVGAYDKAHGLLDAVSQTIAGTTPEKLDLSRRRIFEVAVLFSYRDATARLAMAEGHKEDALTVEHSILANPNAIAPDLIQQHRTLALALWIELGHSADTFAAWVSAGK
jgi:hypothetical protein